MPRVSPKLYFHWLVRKVAVSKDGGRWELLAEIHRKQFTWSVPNDDNRVADAMALRKEFWGEAADDTAVSVLEVIVALSRRLNFQTDGKPKDWAWHLICNLELHHPVFIDPLYHEQHAEISDILDALVWRTYEPSGQGGFFPLAYPAQDQTHVEIWYQMAAYLEEQRADYG